MPRKLIIMSACLTTTLLALSTGAPAAEATPKAKVAFVDAMELPGQMDETRAQLRDLLEAAARERGLDVAPSLPAPACSEPSCYPEVARALGATDLVVVRGGRTAARDYHIELNLWQGGIGDIVPAVADCSFCTGPQMADAAAKAARPLLDRVVERHDAPPTPAAAPAPPAVPSAPPPPDKLEPRRGLQMVGWSLVGLGAATAVAGGIIWSLDGTGADCLASNCKNTYRTHTEGIVLTAAGIVGLGVGLWLALDPFGRGDVALMLGPSGGLVAGRF